MAHDSITLASHGIGTYCRLHNEGKRHQALGRRTPSDEYGEQLWGRREVSLLASRKIRYATNAPHGATADENRRPSCKLPVTQLPFQRPKVCHLLRWLSVDLDNLRLDTGGHVGVFRRSFSGAAYLSNRDDRDPRNPSSEVCRTQVGAEELPEPRDDRYPGSADYHRNPRRNLWAPG